MKSFVIKRNKETKDETVIKEFFCMAENKTEAVRRFCYTTGEKRKSIIEVVEIKQ